ncbi:MAG TPA: VWA domain-containing protein [Candidatus Limnocylindrales bacterium]
MLSFLLALSVTLAPSPSLDVTGVRQEPGMIEFYLSGRDLPSIDTVTVAIGQQQLQTTVERISADKQEAPRRAVVLVIDTSGSMAGVPVTSARAAAQAYADNLPPDVQLGLVAAGAPARATLEPTTDRAAARQAIAGLAAAGETALYDGVRIASGMMNQGEWGQRRIVLLSDGADTVSSTNLATVSGTQIPIDSIAFRVPDSSVLSGIAGATGGRFFTAADPGALSNAFTQAAGSFTAQFLVRATVPPEMNGQNAELTIGAGGATTTIAVQLALDTRVAGPLDGVKAPPPGPLMLLIVAGVVFLGLLVAGLLLASPMFSSAQRRRRLAQLDQFTTAPPLAQKSEGQVAQAALALSAHVLRSANAEGRIAQQLDRAGMRLRPHEWLLLRAISAIVLGLLLGLIIKPIPGFLIGLVLGVVLTSIYHRRKASKRGKAFADLLPDSLQLVTGSLRAGFSLSQAMDAMVRELPDPIAGEFGRALGETRLGVEIEDALDRLAKRMRNQDLAWAVVAIRVQREVGGNLAEVLDNTIATIRERESLRRHVRALSAEGRLSAWVLVLLPLALGAFMAIFRGDYLKPLYTEPLGIVMSVGAVILFALGGLWLTRLSKVEV